MIQQKKLRTSNMAERVNQEVKRRTKVARIFPNIESLLRLVSAICMDIDEDWSTQTKRYLTKE
jgi:transposase-like protein